MHPVQSVWFNDGQGNTHVFSIVTFIHDNGTLDLVTFPASSPIELLADKAIGAQDSEGIKGSLDLFYDL